MTSKTVAVRIVMDESGDCDVATDEAIALDRWKSEFGEGFAGAAVAASSNSTSQCLSPLTKTDQTRRLIEEVLPAVAARWPKPAKLAA